MIGEREKAQPRSVVILTLTSVRLKLKKKPEKAIRDSVAASAAISVKTVS